MNEEQLMDLVKQVLMQVTEGNTSGLKQAASNVQVNSKVSEDCSDEMIPDILMDDYTKKLDIPNPANPEEFLRLKSMTDARIGLGRAGLRYTTNAYLRFLADHAGAMDAVQNDVPEELLEELNLFSVSTKCQSKEEYLTRPDLGRQFDDETKALIRSKCKANPDVQIIVSDGLSSTAVMANIRDLLPAIEQGLKVEGLESGTPFFVKYGRVPAMDPITELLNPKVTIILIGERPGLSTYVSLSAYITYGGYSGIPEGNRTVISNIHQNGTNPIEAGAHIASVAKKMIEQKASGVDLQL